jgi:hypothetical protein
MTINLLFAWLVFLLARAGRVLADAAPVCAFVPHTGHLSIGANFCQERLETGSGTDCLNGEVRLDWT